MPTGAGRVHEGQPWARAGAVLPSRRREPRQALRSPVRGWERVPEVTEHAASLRRDGRATSFEIVAKYVTPALAYVVQIEHLESKVGEKEDVTPYAPRATMIFRPEDGIWKVVHRHADPITTPQPDESVIQE